MWTFNTEHVLRKPAGIALDKHRNVYVAGYETNNIVVLSPDGSNGREIVTNSDGLSGPCSLRFNIDHSELLVCNKRGPASHRHYCQIFTTMYTTFTPLLQ
jgi:DNA-binding beta-propeller fold protein YncE